MNFEYFIANRITKGKTNTRSVTRPVIRFSVWAIAIGMVIMIIALATGNGLRNEIRDKVVGFGGHVQILNYQPDPAFDQAPVQLDDSLLTFLNQDPDIKHIQPVGRKAGILLHDDLFEGVVLKGVDNSFNWAYFNNYITSGKSLLLNDSVYNDTILISESLAGNLKLKEGDKLPMYFVRPAPQAPLLRYFIVGGFYRTDFEDIDDNFIIGDLKHVKRLNKWEGNSVGGYEIYVKDENLTDIEAQRIRAYLPFEYDAVSVRQMNPQLFQWLDLFDFNIYLIILIMIAVSVVNISIALLILILERTNMIGVLKALGSDNWMVRKIFLYNGAYLIGRGLIYGNIIGVGLCFLQQYFGFVKLDPSTYYVSKVAVDINILHILALNGVTMLVAMLCLLIPSLIISKVSPAKSIRFD